MSCRRRVAGLRALQQPRVRQNVRVSCEAFELCRQLHLPGGGCLQCAARLCCVWQRPRCVRCSPWVVSLAGDADQQLSLGLLLVDRAHAQRARQLCRASSR